MPIGKTSGGVSVSSRMELRDKTGRLIYAENTELQNGGLYDRWRARWCNKHRNAECPDGIRDGTKRNIKFALTHLF